MRKIMRFAGLAAGSATASAAGAMTFAVSALAMPHSPAHSDGYGPHMWGGWPASIAGPVIILLVLVAIVSGIVAFVRWLSGEGTGQEITKQPDVAGSTAPVDILKARLARGEIDQAEFEERRKLLER